jgi:ABC-type branched-subunit amino acid transport system ATPase component
MSAPALEICGLSAGYGGRPVLDGVSLTLAQGERLALIGPNGCGKSTLLRAVTAEVVESGGSIRHLGIEIGHMETDEIVRRGVAYLRQTRNIFTGLSVGENLDLASWGDGVDRKAVLASFPVLSDRERVRAGLLSGGERQALAIAMVLMRNVSLLLLDEPIAGLSPKNAAMILEGISKLQRQSGFATIVVEHRLRLIRPHVQRVVIMVRGIIQEDTTDTGILEDQARLEKHYLL